MKVFTLRQFPEEASMLTGRFDFRKTLSGKLVLLLEEDVRVLWSPFRKRSTRRRWRQARVMDLAAPELRPLIDLRSKPNYLAPSRRLEPAPQTEPLDGAVEGAIVAGEPNGEARLSTH
jgi:hypothetical protein